ncbi:MAG TPA: hypothetical protein VF789_19540 [Thermoanaerobaculia bacterium]
MDTAQRSVTWGAIEKLMSSGPEDRQRIVRQLLAGAALEPAAETELVAETTGQYDAALRRALKGTQTIQSRLAQERRDAGRLWSALEGHPPARRQVMIRNDRRFQTWGLFDCLQQRYRHFLHEGERAAALEAAELSWIVAQTLSHTVYGDERVHDFQSSALVALSQARRINRDLEGAKAALSQAEDVLALGTGDLLDRAELESVRADLLQALGHRDAADRAQLRAGRLRKRAGGLRERVADEHLQEPLHHRLHAAIPGFRPRRR